MDLTSVILGPIITEKSERAKLHNTYMIKVAPKATKIDVKKALYRFYDVDVTSVRIQRVGPKFRQSGRGKSVVKRDRYKKAIITLGPKSKPLDLAAFKS